MPSIDLPAESAAHADDRQPIVHGTPAFARTNLALFAGGMGTFSLLYCVQPLMPIFSQRFGVSAATSALSLSLSTGVLAVTMLFAGVISDRWGRKSVMAISLIISTLLVMATALVPGWASLLVLRALLGLSLSGVPVVAMTYLAEEVHPQSIGLGMGLYISGNAIGGMAGRLVAGVVADYFGWRAGMGAVAGIGVVASAVFIASLPPSRFFQARPLHLPSLLKRFAHCFADAGLPWLFLEGFVLLGAFVTLYNYVGYHLLAPPFDLSQSEVGLVFGVYLVGTFSSTWMGALAGRLGRRKVLWSAFVLMLAGIALTLASSVWLVVLGVAVVTFGFFGGHSIVSSWTGRRAGVAKAQASSLYLFSYYLGSSVAGVGGGVFYAHYGWHGVAGFVGAMVLLGLLMAWRLYHLTPLAGPPSPGNEPPLPDAG